MLGAKKLVPFWNNEMGEKGKIVTEVQNLFHFGTTRKWETRDAQQLNVRTCECVTDRGGCSYSRTSLSLVILVARHRAATSLCRKKRARNEN
jgi:hypothetical protein